MRNLVPVRQSDRQTVRGDKGRMRHKAFRCMAGVERFHEAIKSKPPLTLHLFLAEQDQSLMGAGENPWKTVYMMLSSLFNIVRCKNALCESSSAISDCLWLP